MFSFRSISDVGELVPEEFIAGKVAFIWDSINPINDKIRWNRLGRIK